MKAASTLLALVVVLGFARPAVAGPPPEHFANFSFRIGEQRFGIRDVTLSGAVITPVVETGTQVCFGPLGAALVPFTATQGLVGFCVIVVGLIALVTMLTFRWKRKAANQK